MKYHLTLWSKAIYEKISHINPLITWYIRPGHGIFWLGNLNLIQYIMRIWMNLHSSIIQAFSGPCLFCLFRGGAEFGETCLHNTCIFWGLLILLIPGRGGVQNMGKPAYIYLHALIPCLEVENLVEGSCYSCCYLKWKQSQILVWSLIIHLVTIISPMSEKIQELGLKIQKNCIWKPL